MEEGAGGWGATAVPALKVSVEVAVAGDFSADCRPPAMWPPCIDGESQPTHILERDGSVMAGGEVTRLSASEYLPENRRGRAGPSNCLAARAQRRIRPIRRRRSSRQAAWSGGRQSVLGCRGGQPSTLS